MGTDSAVFGLLQNALRAAELRQTVYSNNVANVDTPGYKRQDVEFEDILNQNLLDVPVAEPGTRFIPVQNPAASDWENLANVSPVVIQDNTSKVDNNGNNVDIDAEMAKLAMNQIRYNALIQDVNIRLNRLRSAINGGS
jgi:flagellar basal-body rod protein FlgB